MSKVVLKKTGEGLSERLYPAGSGVQFDDNMQLQGTVNVAGAATLATTLGVTGISTLTGGLVLGTEAIAAAGAASTTVAVSLVTPDGADMAVTLDDGSTTGQVKIFITMADANSWKVTPDTTTGAYTKVTCTLAGDTVILMWDGAGWALLSRMSGAAQGATAVVGQPIVA